MGGQALVIVREPRALPMSIGHQRTVALLGHQFASSSLDGGDRGADVFLRYVVSNHDIVPSRMDRWDAALPSASVGVNQFRTVEKTKPRCEGPAPSESRIWSRFAPLIRFHCSTVGGVRQDVFRGGEEKGGVGGGVKVRVTLNVPPSEPPVAAPVRCTQRTGGSTGCRSAARTHARPTQRCVRTQTTA